MDWFLYDNGLCLERVKYDFSKAPGSRPKAYYPQYSAIKEMFAILALICPHPRQSNCVYFL